MPAIRSIDKIAEKWATVTPQRAPQYSDGVKNPKKDWAKEATAAEERYKAAVTAAANEGRYGKGVKRAGTEKWQNMAAKKGPSRYAEGVMVAKPNYQSGFAPFAEEIAKTELPPRGPKGDPANINRVAAIAKALHEKKKALLGGA